MAVRWQQSHVCSPDDWHRLLLGRRGLYTSVATAVECCSYRGCRAPNDVLGHKGLDSKVLARDIFTHSSCVQNQHRRWRQTASLATNRVQHKQVPRGWCSSGHGKASNSECGTRRQPRMRSGLEWHAHMLAFFNMEHVQAIWSNGKAADGGKASTHAHMCPHNGWSYQVLLATSCLQMHCDDACDERKGCICRTRCHLWPLTR